MYFKQWYRSFLPRIPFLYKPLHKAKRWLKERIIQENIFDDLGFEYLGPMDGHDIPRMVVALEWAKKQKRPCLVHVITKKGKGFGPAETHPEIFHGVGAFDPDTGYVAESGTDFSAVFGEELCRLGAEDDRVTAITAAMKEGTGLVEFGQKFPKRFFDVGIAEEHAVAMAAGMASQGLVPVFAVYSTFLQRSYDMLIHDISLMNLHVVLGVDRAGIVGKDGQTHQGVFDVAFLSTVPGMTVYAPASFGELRSMLRRAVLEETGPVAVRYARGGEGAYKEDYAEENSVCLRDGTDVTVVSYGLEINEALKAADILAEAGVSAEVIKVNRLCPLDASGVIASVEKTGRLAVAEDVCRAGCLGERLLCACGEAGVDAKMALLLNLGDGILENGAPNDLKKLTGLDGEGIARRIMEKMHEEDKA